MSRRAVFIISIFLTVIFPLKGFTDSGIHGTEPIENLPLEQKIAKLFILKAYPAEESSRDKIRERLKNVKPGGLVLDGGLPGEITRMTSTIRELVNYEIFLGRNLSLIEIGLPEGHIIAGSNSSQLIGEAGIYTASSYSNIGINFLITTNKHLPAEYYNKLTEEGLLTISPGEVPQTGFNGMILPFEAGYEKRNKVRYDSTFAYRLRNRGYKDLLILNLEDVPDSLNYEEVLLGAFNSTFDLFLFPENMEESIEIIKRAIKSGKIKKEELDAKLKRIYAGRFFPPGPRDRNLSHKELYSEIMTSSITLLKNTGDILPVRVLDTLNIANVTLSPLYEELNTYLSYYTNITQFPGLDETNIHRLGYFDIVTVHLDNDISDTELGRLEKLCENTRVVLISNPEMLERLDLSLFSAVIISHTNGEAIQKYLAQKIFGSLPFKGLLYTDTWVGAGIQRESIKRLGFAEPGQVGMDPTVLNSIDSIAFEAIEKEATPGCQVLVARKGSVIFNESYGYHTYDKKVPVDNETIYDIASLTKVIATLQTVMFMDERNVIDINHQLSKYLPELRGTNKESIVIGDVLLHQAGLRPFVPFWLQTMNDEELSPEYYSYVKNEDYRLEVSEGIYAVESLRDSIWNWIIDSKLLRKSYHGSYKYRYSDVGFYMMQQLAERQLNQPLNDFVKQNYYDPLGMTSTSYLPLCNTSIENIPPTAIDHYFRQQVIEGIVHDEGAAMFGGVAGHAGLFSKSLDLAKISQMLLWEGEYGDQKYYNPETIRKFTARQVKDNRRGLGWDKPDPAEDEGPTSDFASMNTFGHTGFTGTAVWIDPEYDLIFVFLSNRIHPDPENTKLMSLDIRTRIQDVVYRSIMEYDNKHQKLSSPEP